MINYILLAVVSFNLGFSIFNRDINGSLGWLTASVLALGSVVRMS